MNATRSHTKSESPAAQGQPADRFRKIDAPQPMLPCRLCGSPSELWQRWEKDDIWFSYGCCTNLEDVDGEPCTFHLPDSVAFYRPRKIDAVRYWNLIMGPRAIPCSERMPPSREYVLMWETPSLRWSVGDWMPEYQQWSNRDDREYAIHPHQVSHWLPLPDAPLSDEGRTP